MYIHARGYICPDVNTVFLVFLTYELTGSTYPGHKRRLAVGDDLVYENPVLSQDLRDGFTEISYPLTCPCRYPDRCV